MEVTLKWLLSRASIGTVRTKEGALLDSPTETKEGVLLGSPLCQPIGFPDGTKMGNKSDSKDGWPMNGFVDRQNRFHKEESNRCRQLNLQTNSMRVQIEF